MIGILDNGMGNLRSVWNAVYELGYDPVLVEDDTTLDDLSHLVIPGVGHFGSAMRNLVATGRDHRIVEFAASGRPILGICLGMQLLASRGTEGGDTAGLGLIPGAVTLLPAADGLRLPHVGWNTVHVRHAHPVFRGLKPNRDFYFVHSYAMRCDADTDWLAETDYGEPFTCIAGRANVIGFQFHPEKSQVSGLLLLKNFCAWDGTC
ncbi:MAG: imidazole glycerol phosphate synthase subunit HisH [Gammaproteobacteria bacterium]